MKVVYKILKNFANLNNFELCILNSGLIVLYHKTSRNTRPPV